MSSADTVTDVAGDRRASSAEREVVETISCERSPSSASRSGAAAGVAGPVDGGEAGVAGAGFAVGAVATCAFARGAKARIVSARQSVEEVWRLTGSPLRAEESRH